MAAAPVLIELFTAEGCSSCPPADHFLEQLDTTQPIRGAHLIVLSEHVDDWDRQGWPDPYASKGFTDRQVAYERSLKVNEPFTPQFVVDGTIDMRLSRRERISGSCWRSAPRKSGVSIESLRVGGDAAPAISGVVLVAGMTGDRPCELFVGVALDHADTQVLRGENRGQHHARGGAARLVRVGAVAPGAPSRQFSLALRRVSARHAPRVIAFVQQPGSLGAVLGPPSRPPARDGARPESLPHPAVTARARPVRIVQRLRETAYDSSHGSSRIAHACRCGAVWRPVAGIGYDGHESGFIGQTLLVDSLFLSDGTGRSGRRRTDTTPKAADSKAPPGSRDCCLRGALPGGAGKRLGAKRDSSRRNATA